jgi:hypothetical protein
MEPEICAGCLALYEEEGLDISTTGMLEMLAVLGEELPDHLCDELEEGGRTRCRCGCHPLEKKKQRRERQY